MAQIKTNLQYGVTGSLQTGSIAADAITDAKIADDVVGTEHLTAGEVDATAIADNAITLAKMAGGTDGNLITYDASGNPAYVASGTSGHFLKSQGADTVPVFAAGGGLIKQIVSATMGSVDASTTSNTSFTAVASRSDIITVDKGNKVLVIVTGLLCKNNSDSSSAFSSIEITDGTNTTNNKGITTMSAANGLHCNDKNYSMILTTASGVGTVGIDLEIQGTSDGDTVYFNCNNDTYGLQCMYTCFEIVV